MSNRMKLGDVATVVMGQAPHGAACNKDGIGEPFVKAGEFREPYPVIREWTTAPTKRAQSGDVLVCVVGATAGKINLGIDCVIGRSVAAVRPLPTRLDTHYLYHFLVTKTLVLRASSQGMAQGVITREMLLETEIPLPPLEEQRRIAAILDKADQLRSHSRLLIKEVLLVEQSIFETLFGQFVSGSSAYPAKALEEIVQDNRIGLVRASNECGPEMPHSYIKMDAIDKNGRLQIHKAIKTSASPEELADYSVRDGDVLFNTRNSRELVGKTAVYRGAEEMLFNNNLMRLRFNPNTISPDFFRLFLSSRRGASELEGRKSGTTSVCAVYWKNLKTMPVPVPPCDLQIQLAKSLERLERLTGKYCLQETYCDDLVKTLRSDLIGGSH